MGIFQVTNYLVPLLLIPILLQRIGLENYGTVALAQGIMTVLISFCDFGFNMTGTRLISQNSLDKNYLSRLISQILYLKATLVVAGFTLLFLLTQIIPSWNENQLIILSSFGIVVGQAFFPVWYFQGMQRLSRIMAFNFLSRAIYLIFVLFLVQSSSDAYLVNILNGASWIIISALAVGIMQRQLALRLVFIPPAELWNLAKSNLAIFASNFISETFRSGGILIAGFLFNASDLGLYSVLDKIILLFHNTFAAIFRAIFPRIASLSKDLNEIKKIFKKYYLRFGGLTLLGMVMLISLGDIVISSFSSEITREEVAPFSFILAFIPLMIFLNLPISVSLVALDLKKEFLTYNTLIALSFLVFGTSLALLFGLSGLLAGHLAAQIAAGLCGIYFLRRISIKFS